MVARLGYAALGFPDYWGDAYHNWMMSRLTIENHGILTDYKGREVVWEPLFRYVSTAVMYLTGRSDMLPGRLVSLVASSLTCGVTAALTTRLTRERWLGLLAGLTLALTPWHIAYGWMYMPEATAGLFVMLVLYEVSVGQRSWTIVLFAALAALTRNDASLVLILAAVWLGVTGHRRTSLAVAAGVVLGLSVWSTWTWYAAGDPLWWLVRRRAGSTADAAFWSRAGARPVIGPWTLPLTLVQVYAPILTLLTAAVAGFRSPEWRRAVWASGRSLYAFLFLSFLPVIGIMQIRFFSYPDPRYLLVIVPVASCVTAFAVGPFLAQGRRKLVPWGHGAVVALSLLIQIPTFAFRPYTLIRDRLVGDYLRQAAPATGALWVDAPVAIYYSGIEPNRFRSSDQLAPAPESLPEAIDSAYAALAREPVTMIYWDLVPYTRVPLIWPEMTSGEAFDARGYRFEPVFRYDSWRRPEGDRSLAHLARERIEQKYGPAIVWSVARLP
ncbi:MAG: hypothetical protein EXR93_01840 [Gemmatimonadetes bacterium]|nr:hypothetical protein [Gemmatimonadota bacterium]